MMKTPSSRIAIAIIASLFASLTPSAAFAQSDDNLHLTEKRDLANVLGRVHYVRTLCNGKSDQYWRNFMRDFLDLEATDSTRRSLFVKAFNYGYRFQSDQMERGCTTDTQIVEARLAKEGRVLAETIARGYLR